MRCTSNQPIHTDACERVAAPRAQMIGARYTALRGNAMCNVRWVFSLISTLAVLGCAGVGVVASSDPAVKLRDAEVLYSEEQRPLIAERLIREAIHIYEEHGDSLGLGHAYRSYGKLLLSSSIIQWSQFYREHGFQDKSVTFDNRREKAKDYFAKSLEPVMNLRQVE